MTLPPRSRPSRAPGSFLVATLLVALAPLLVRPATAQSEATATRFLMLESADPPTVRDLLRPLLDERLRIHVTRDETGPTDLRGRLVISGPPELVDSTVSLVTLIDGAPGAAAATPSRLDFYDASGLEDRVVSAAMQPLFGPFRDARYSIASGGLLTVYGPDELHERVIETLALVRQRLAELRANAAADAADEEPPADAPTADRLVRLTWLGTQPGDLVGDLGRAVSDDMRPVVRQLETLGLEGWRELGRASVMAAFDDEFRIETGFTPAGTGRWQLQWEGFLQEWDENVARLATNLVVSGTDGSTVELSTTLEVAPGKRVVLGLTPVADMHSAFVIEIVEPAAE